MNLEQPAPVLLGYRPRKPWVANATFGMPGVTAVASVSSCMTSLLAPDPPEFERLNSALHYPTVQEARAAARRAGEENGEIHATLLYSLVFDGEHIDPVQLRLTHPAAETVPASLSPDPFETLGLDIVALVHPSSDHTTGKPLEHIAFGCAPLSCNGLGKNFPVNRWCLLDRWDDAVHAATQFVREESEPGPFVIVEIRRVVRPALGIAKEDRVL